MRSAVGNFLKQLFQLPKVYFAHVFVKERKSVWHMPTYEVQYSCNIILWEHWTSEVLIGDKHTFTYGNNSLLAHPYIFALIDKSIITHKKNRLQPLDKKPTPDASMEFSRCVAGTPWTFWIRFSVNSCDNQCASYYRVTPIKIRERKTKFPFSAVEFNSHRRLGMTTTIRDHLMPHRLSCDLLAHSLTSSTACLVLRSYTVKLVAIKFMDPVLSQ